MSADIFSLIDQTPFVVSEYLKFSAICDQLFEKQGRRKMRIGIACSGGPDSVLVLYFLLRYQKLNPDSIDFLVVLHVIDGQEQVDVYLQSSVKKSLVVLQKISSQTGVLIDIIQNNDTSVFFPDASFEAICHDIRKNIFTQKIAEYNLDRIFTGHNKNDQIEHFFIGIIRQSSIKRISGMRVDSGKYLRPLLFLTKEKIVAILKELKIDYLDDVCNTLPSSLRNKIRAKIIPLFSQIDERSESSILSFMSELSSYEEYIDGELNKILASKEYYQIAYFQNLSSILQKKIIEKELYKKNMGNFSSKKIINEINRFLIHSKNSQIHTIKKKIIISKTNLNWRVFLINKK
jgi:tRNA(Ile)-lysidine synthetase-like protein